MKRKSNTKRDQVIDLYTRDKRGEDKRVHKALFTLLTPLPLFGVPYISRVSAHWQVASFRPAKIIDLQLALAAFTLSLALRLSLPLSHRVSLAHHLGIRLNHRHTAGLFQLKLCRIRSFLFPLFGLESRRLLLATSLSPLIFLRLSLARRSNSSVPLAVLIRIRIPQQHSHHRLVIFVTHRPATSASDARCDSAVSVDPLVEQHGRQRR